MTAPSTRKATCHDPELANPADMAAPPPRPRLVDQRFDVPVSVDEALCIDGCTLDALAIDPETNKAYMQVDECWYGGPSADSCPTGAVTVNIPYLLR